MTYAARYQHPVPGHDSDVLVHQHLQLVRKLAWHVHARVSSALEIEELIQAGVLALVEAARSFEDRGFEFSTYASLRIKGAMIDLLRKASGQPRSASSTRRKIEQTRREIELEHGARATQSAIAARLNLSAQGYTRLEQDAQGTRFEPLDVVYTDEESSFCASDPLQDAALDRTRLTALLADAVRNLDPRSQQVLQLYFFDNLNLDEIGEILSISAARICQIKKAALLKLKAIEGLSDLLDIASLVS